jgi:uncharacterized protein (TIGR00290 family)
MWFSLGVGGKDSALALHALRRDETPVRALLTTVTEDYERISMHGVRRELLQAQALAAELPLVEVRIPPSCPFALYETRMAETLALPELEDCRGYAFGDIFLEDLREYREERLASVGKEAVFPIWGRDTGELARQFVTAFEAVVVCVDPRSLPAAFCGRLFDSAFLADLPLNTDLCGENGEFHTLVTAGPIFATPLAWQRGEVVERGGFAFCDVLAKI